MKPFRQAISALYVFVLASFITACAVRPPLVEKAQIAEYKQPGMALIVGSLVVGSGNMSYDHWEMKFRLRDPGKEFNGAIKGSINRQIPGDNAFDFRGRRFSGNVFAMVVPAGTYEYYSYSLFKNNGLAHVTWYPKSEFSIPFRVEENKINYVGEIVVHPQVGKNLLGLAATSWGIWSMGEALERDLPLLKARYPDQDWESLITVLPARSEQPEVVIVNKDNQHLYASYARPNADYQQNLLDEINTGKLERNREIAQQLVKDAYFDEVLLDALVVQVKANYLMNRDDRLWVDSVAWMCRAIATSKNQKYQPFIQEVSKSAANEKLRNYATGYLRYF